MAVVSHTPEFFQQRCSNDPNRAVEIAFAAKNELSQRLTTVTALATKKPLVEQSGETRRDCRTVLHYVDPVKAPAEWLADPNATKSEPSLHAVWGSVDKGVPFVVEDVRGREQDFTLDRNGLVWPTHKSALSPEDLIDNDKVKSQYYSECIELLKQICPTAKSVHIMHHTTRSTDRNSSGRPAAYKMHVDQELQSRIEFLYEHGVLPRAIADEVVHKKKRWQILNIWRPIYPVVKDPLALCDLQSLSASDLRDIRFNLPHGVPTGHTGAVPNPAQRLYYKSHQRPDEPVVFLQFDSSPQGHDPALLGRVPHAAVIDDEAEERALRAAAATDADGHPGYPERWSIEVRLLVVYDEEGPMPPDHQALAEALSAKKAREAAAMVDSSKPQQKSERVPK